MSKLAPLLLLVLAGCAAHAAAPPPADDYATHVEALRKRLPDSGKAFTILVQKPFVVIGDDPDITTRIGAPTVQWTVDHLRKDYFSKDPGEILDIYLFKDKESYEKYTWELFHTHPNTPYGYYSPTDKALIMNISTGGGTLVHEIVHPFVRTNFPDCPAWFNEGLGSLYEQSAERDGHIIGQTNWRLEGLQRVIAAGTLPSFESLCSTTTAEFYGPNTGTNYAQARYLLYYLQENGLLLDYYKLFTANQKGDPTGYKTLQKVLKTQDMAAFQKEWEKGVMDLRFP